MRTDFGISKYTNEKNFFRVAFLCQYIPRIYRMVQLIGGVSANGFIFESAWANFVINLLMFILTGHVVGACWYLLGLQVSECVYCVYILSNNHIHPPLNLSKLKYLVFTSFF